MLGYSYQSNTANQALDTILSIQPKDVSTSGGDTREAVVYAAAQDMLDKLPADYNPYEVSGHVIFFSYMIKVCTSRHLSTSKVTEKLLQNYACCVNERVAYFPTQHGCISHNVFRMRILL